MSRGVDRDDVDPIKWFLTRLLRSVKVGPRFRQRCSAGEPLLDAFDGHFYRTHAVHDQRHRTGSAG
jgi:hypothetical protein